MKNGRLGELRKIEVRMWNLFFHSFVEHISHT